MLQVTRKNSRASRSVVSLVSFSTSAAISRIRAAICFWSAMIRCFAADSASAFEFMVPRYAYLDLQMSRTGTDVKDAGRHSFKCV
ncbi:hypothetical protein [Rhizobium sp. IY2]|uniref:hypothetical protein n=1 Tax=Rhizobium TaxID=379 RepID=UPI0039DF9FB4